MKQWLTSPGSSCIECSRLFPFSCSTFSKSNFCFEQAVGQRHQSECQCIRVHHTVIPTRLPSIQNNRRTCQPLRHGPVPQELGLWSPCVCLQSPDWSSVVTRGVHDPVAESASKCFSFALSGTRNLTIFSLFVLGLSSSFYDFTVQCIAVNPCIVHCQRQTLFSVF